MNTKYSAYDWGEPHTSMTSLHLCAYMFAYLDRPLTVSHFRLLFYAFVSCVNSKRARGYVAVNREQITSSMARTTTRGLTYSLSRAIEVTAWQSVDAVCLCCLTHGSCHWTQISYGYSDGGCR